MSEKVFNPFSKKEAIDEGLGEYRGVVRSKEGPHHEIDVFDFEREYEPNPLRKEDLEKDIEGFVQRNWNSLLPFFIDQGVDHSTLVERFEITNEDIGNLGADYFIRVLNGKKKIFKADENFPDGREVGVDNLEIKISEILALAVLKKMVRVDSLQRSSRHFSSPARRYFYKPAQRYLASNDFGMRIWDADSSKMINGDVTDALPMVRTIAQQIDRIAENIHSISGLDVGDRYNELKNEYINAVREEVAREVNALSREDLLVAYAGIDEQYNVGDEFREWMREKLINHRTAERFQRQYRQQAEQQVLARASAIFENLDNRDLVLTSIPARKIRNQIRYKSDRLIADCGLDATTPIDAYHKFAANPQRYVKMLTHPSKVGAVPTDSLEYVTFGKSKKTVLLSEHWVAGSLEKELEFGLKNALAAKVIESDEKLLAYRSGKGPESPYFYGDHELLDLIEVIGRKNVEQALERDYRSISEQVRGGRYLKYCLGNPEVNGVVAKKQLKEAQKLFDSGMWSYLALRERGKIEEQHGKLPDEIWNTAAWLEYVQPRRARQLFAEGKHMYWLAQRCFQLTPGRDTGDRFYKHHFGIDWRVYELSGVGLSEDKLKEHLNKNIKLIASFLNLKSLDESAVALENEVSPVTLEALIRALDMGKDLSGALFARDKKNFFDVVARGEVPATIDESIRDWPKEWKGAVARDEIEVAYEYAVDYLTSDPGAFTGYVSWRATTEGKEWGRLFADPVESRSDLDFRISISMQTLEVRNWYKEAAEYAGTATMQKYLLRFNALRDPDGGFRKIHDVLYWVPNIRNMDAGDAKQVLGNIQTMDENQEFIQLLQQYRKQDDPLAARNGAITSLRELKKRVLAIEANIDFSSLPDTVIAVTSAPGFSAVALKDLQREERFNDLVNGELDKKQPFEPRTRIFPGRDLVEALREGLGSQKQGIKGTAKDSKTLFHALNQLIRGRRVGERKMQVVDLFESIPPDLEEAIMQLLKEQHVDSGPAIEAVVHAKSDPEGWVCGNYTDCCMPFGDFKNTDYMFNAGTQYFTIKYNGRIIAQSVVVDGRDAQNNSDVVILDNIEIANNYKHLSSLLARVYQTFWTEYTSRPVKVGTGYLDLIPPGAKLEPNHYYFKYHLSYSDAIGSQIYDMPKMRGLDSLDKQITFANLGERDAELITRMEQEAYPEEGMALGKAHISEILQKQRDLEVPGAASSFVVRQGKEPAGYLLILPEESEYTGERVAHIYDMAVLPKFRGFTVAAKIMERVLDVASAYGVSIEAEARASTTYALLMNRRVREWLKTKGFEVTRSEKLESYLGGEDFYFVRLENKRSETSEQG